jgi:membrane protein DedA with SNARE-associated domain
MRRGVWFVLFYHFAGYTRVIGPTAAGLLRMPFRRWAMADYGGAVLWVFGYFAIGYGLGIAGLSLDSTDRWFRVAEWVLVVAMVLWVQMLLKTRTELFGGKSQDDSDTTEADDSAVETDADESPVAREQADAP